MSSGPCFVSGSDHDRLGASPIVYSSRVGVLNHIRADCAQASTFESLSGGGPFRVAAPRSENAPALVTALPRALKAAFAAPVGGHRGGHRQSGSNVKIP